LIEKTERDTVNDLQSSVNNLIFSAPIVQIKTPITLFVERLLAMILFIVFGNKPCQSVSQGFLFVFIL